MMEIIRSNIHHFLFPNIIRMQMLRNWVDCEEKQNLVRVINNYILTHKCVCITLTSDVIRDIGFQAANLNVARHLFKCCF